MAENYIVSARKYRPQTFDTVVGQSHITTTLKNAIKNNHLAHAYLFCGPRGVGKTTCARILAKTINCEQPTADMEACGECKTCKAFADHTSFNVFELDAASNNSVDDIRELVSQVRFAPQSGKYKIYIIDEVHMLSASAFNAFLKTLEEPPPYAIFILATTEKHKILPTILSRCQIFDFKRIVTEDISDHLHSIATKESVVAQEAALHVIAQKSEGCMRDALSMFDRIVSFSNGMLTYNNTMEHLNMLDADYYFKITDLILAQDVSSTLLQLDEAIDRGFEGDVILEGMAEHLRNLLLCKDPRMAKLLDVPNDHKPVYHEKANQAPPSFIISALHVVNEAEINYRNANNKRLHVEMCFIRLCYLLQATQADEKKNDEPLAAPAPVKQVATTPKSTVTPSSSIDKPPAFPPKSTPEAQSQSKIEQPPVQPKVERPQPQQEVKPTAAQNTLQQSSTPPPQGAIPARRIRKNIMDEIDAAVNNAENTAEQEQKELTLKLAQDVFQKYKDLIHSEQKSMLHAQLLQMSIEIYPPDEVRIICPTDLTDTYARDQRNAILDYYREHTGIMVRVTTEVRKNESVEAQQQNVVLSKQEMFDALVQKNPELGKLKDALNLQIEY